MIRDWADERGLYENGDTKTQALKLVEEVGETCRAILKEDREEVIDGIGDCVVVLTNLAELVGVYQLRFVLRPRMMRLKTELERWLTERIKKINMSSREIMDARNGITSRKEYGFRDPVVRNVVDKFVSRSDVGFAKYNSTLDDERRLKMKNLQGYLNDIQEELMDAVLYIQAARDELQDLSEEALIDKFRVNEEAI